MDGPSLAGLPLCRVVPHPLDDSAVVAGILPDMAGWHDGDVLLFRNATQNAMGTLITASMTRRYGAAAARWTHAAIYAGEGMIIQAVASNPRVVQEVAISRYVPSRVIARRAIPILTDAERREIVAAARATIGRNYNYMRAMQAGLAGLKIPQRQRLGRRKRAAALRACICSDVVIDAYLIGANVTLAPDVTGVASPAALYLDTNLKFQPVTLCRIQGSS